MVVLGTLGRIHQLNGGALRRAIGAGKGHDVLFAQDRHLSLDEQPRALIDIGDDAIANDHTFVRFELDLQRHDRPRRFPASLWMGVNVLLRSLAAETAAGKKAAEPRAPPLFR